MPTRHPPSHSTPLWVWFFGQLVQCKADGALNGGSRLLLGLPLFDGKLILQLL
jgi:hypothetical protein